MGFFEDRIPTNVAYRTTGGPGFNVEVIELPSGAEERVARWASARREYDAKYIVKSLADLGTLVSFILVHDGQLYGFRWKDWLDYASTASGRTGEFAGGAVVSHQDQVIGTGNGVQTQFQLVKTYTSGIYSKVRTIQKPVDGTVVIAFGVTQQLSGWTVDTTTGIVTFTTAPTLGQIVRAGFEFDVPVRADFDPRGLAGITIESFNTASLPNLPLKELVNENPASDLPWAGGSKALGVVTEDVSITLNTGRMIVGEPNTAGLKVILPDAKNIADGGPHFLIANEGSEDWSVVNSSDEEIVLIPSGGEPAEIWLQVDGVGNKIWWSV